MRGQSAQSEHGGWRTAALGEIADVKLGKMLDRAKHTAGQLLPYLRNVNVRWGRIETDDLLEMYFRDTETERYGLRPGDVLVCEGGEPGRAAVWDGRLPNLRYQKALHRVRFKEPYDPRLFVYLMELLARTGGLDQQFTGSTIKHLTRRTFVQVRVPIPPPGEQRAIVDEIEKQLTRLDAGVAALERIQANLKRYRAAVLKAACEGRLVPTEAELARREGRSYEPVSVLLERIKSEKAKVAAASRRSKQRRAGAATLPGDLPPLPEGWAWATLGDSSWDASYGTSVRCGQDFDGPPVARIPNVQSGSLDWADTKRAPASFPVPDSATLATGDMLIIRTNGSKSLLGRCAIIRNVDRRATYASYLIRFRLCGNEVMWTWLGTVWHAEFLRTWIESHAASSAGQHNVSMSLLSLAPIPVPPLAEQQRIVAEVEHRLSLADDVDRIVSANLKRAARLRLSILAAAFSGNLHPTDLNRESAETV